MKFKKKAIKIYYIDKKIHKYNKKGIDNKKNLCYNISITTTEEFQKMKNYRIARNQSFRAGEEIKLEKVTTAERIGGAVLKILLIAGIIINMIIIHG